MRWARRHDAVVAALAISLVAGVASAGEIVGRVAVIGRRGKVVSKPGATLVYIGGLPAPVAPTDVTIRMEHKAFIPRIVAVPVGSTVRFPNHDPIFHNVFSVSRSNRFDLDLYKRPGSRSTVMSKPGVVRVYCNIHPQMTAIILVRDNPYFAWVARDGTFRLQSVPAGRYRLTVWNERAEEVSTTVQVPEQGQARADLRLDASHYRRVRHKNKYGRDYRSDAAY